MKNQLPPKDVKQLFIFPGGTIGVEVWYGTATYMGPRTETETGWIWRDSEWHPSKPSVGPFPNWRDLLLSILTHFPADTFDNWDWWEAMQAQYERYDGGLIGA